MPFSVYSQMMMTDDEILVHVVNSTGVIALNRPKVLNALSLTIIREIAKTLKQWRTDDSIQRIVFEGVGKAFCAGGDIRAVYDAKKQGNRAFGDSIFREEYAMNCLIHTYEKPIISLINGYCMGGGMGVSVHGRYRIVTELATMAMPETTIGFFPDIGAGYFLNQCPGSFGLWMGLLGEKIYAADMINIGLATHYAPSHVLDGLRSALTNPNISIDSVLKEFCKNPPISVMANLLPTIEEIFGNASSVEEIIKRLEACDHPKAKEWLTTLSQKSPTSLKITFESLKRARGKSITDVLHQEFRLSQRCVEGHDFCEGVRALLVDKDAHPKWQPSRLEDVTNEMVESYFAPLTDRNELFAGVHIRTS